MVKNALDYLHDIPESRRKISAEYVIFALDLAACPYIEPSIRIKFLQQFGVSRQIGGDILKFMKRQKYMFTKWTGIDLTKELNAKISQEVYS